MLATLKSGGRMTSGLRLSIIVLATLVAEPARASFLGHQLTVVWHFPTYDDVLEAHEVLVGPGVEFPPLALRNANLTIDIGADWILFQRGGGAVWQNQSANGFEFIDSTGSIDRIVGFTIGDTEGVISGLDPEDLSFTDDSVFVNFGSSGPTGANSWTPGPSGTSSVRLDVTFVPEPSSGPLLAAGLAVLVLGRQRPMDSWFKGDISS